MSGDRADGIYACPRPRQRLGTSKPPLDARAKKAFVPRQLPVNNRRGTPP